MVSDFPSAGLVRVAADAPMRQKLLLVEHGPMSMALFPRWADRLGSATTMAGHRHDRRYRLNDRLARLQDG